MAFLFIAVLRASSLLALKPFSSGSGSLYTFFWRQLTDICHSKRTGADHWAVRGSVQSAFLEQWEQNSWQALRWRAGVEGFDKTGQPGAGCQHQHIPAAARGCASCIFFAGPFQRNAGCSVGFPGRSQELCPSRSAACLCAWVLGIPGQGKRLDVTSSNNPGQGGAPSQAQTQCQQQHKSPEAALNQIVDHGPGWFSWTLLVLPIGTEMWRSGSLLLLTPSGSRADNGGDQGKDGGQS